MNIFSDFHHSSLFYSLQLLFEKRLGYSLFRPIGMSWWEEGYWKIVDHPDTAEQYLGMRQGYQPKDGTPPLNTPDSFTVGEFGLEGKNHDYILYCEDKHHNTVNKALTFKTFKDMNIDIVIASIPNHIKPYKELARMKNAKFIFQMGNMFTEVLNNLHEIPNLLSSTIQIPVPPTCNAVFYHQEFPLEVFKPSSFPPEKQITSFINVYHENGGFQDYLALKAIMPDYEFKSYGGQCQDGGIVGIDQMASIMQQSYFGFHSKYMGDGYGHVLYNWYACGKPVLTRISDYKGKLGEELLTDKETCLDIDRYSMEELKYIIENLSPVQYEYMCQSAYQRFTSCVDFDAEELKIRNFLNNLK